VQRTEILDTGIFGEIAKKPCINLRKYCFKLLIDNALCVFQQALFKFVPAIFIAPKLKNISLIAGKS
jgi:hypothetical protein